MALVINVARTFQKLFSSSSVRVHFLYLSLWLALKIAHSDSVVTVKNAQHEFSLARARGTILARWRILPGYLGWMKKERLNVGCERCELSLSLFSSFISRWLHNHRHQRWRLSSRRPPHRSRLTAGRKARNCRPASFRYQAADVSAARRVTVTTNQPLQSI